MSLMLPGCCGCRALPAAIVVAAVAAVPSAFAQSAAAPPPAASVPSTGDAAPNERAKRDAEKVFHWIMIQGDRTRKTTPIPSKEVKDAKDDKPAAPKATAARGSAPARAGADSVPEVVLRPKGEAGATAPAPRASEIRSLVEAAKTPQGGDNRADSAAALAARLPAGNAAATQRSDALPAKPGRTEPVASSAVPATDGADNQVVLVPLAQPEPQFPINVMRALRRGTVQVRFSVRPDGSVADLEVLHTSNSRLNAAALAAVGQWRFQPIARAQTGAVEVGFNLE